MWMNLPEGQLGGAQPGPMATLGSELYMATSPFGSISPGAAMPHPTFWRSSDGSTWQRLPDSPVFAGVPMRWIDVVGGLVPHGLGLIAVGAQVYADSSTANAAAWMSPDGKTWTRATVEGATDATMNFAYATAGGFVAIGTDGYSFHAGMERGSAIWTSTDGTRWSRLPSSAIPSGIAMNSVAHGDGRYIAVGEALPPGGSPTRPIAPIWTSSDGVHWQMIPASTAVPADATLPRVVWTGSAFVAVGERPTIGAFAWRSSDGLTWRSTDLPTGAAPGSPQVVVDDDALTPTTLLAVGSVTDAAGVNHPVVWESADGAVWRLVTLPAEFDGVNLQQIIMAAGHIFVMGETEQGAARVWMLDPGTAGH